MIKNNYYIKSRQFLLNKFNVRFLFFVLAATLFWFALKLNEQKTYDITIPLEYEPAPGYEIVQGADRLTVTVQGDVIDINRLDGQALSVPLIEVQRQIIDYNTIKSLLTAQAPKNTVILGMSPGSIEIVLSPQISKKVPVIVDYQLNLPSGFSLTMPPLSTPDSVTVMGTSELLNPISSISTQKINVNKAEKTFIYRSSLKQPNEKVVMTPQHVEITVNVDQMIEKDFLFNPMDLFGELGFTRNQVKFSADIPMSEYDEINITNFSLRLDSTLFANRKVLRIIGLLPQIKNISPTVDTLIIINNEKEL